MGLPIWLPQFQTRCSLLSAVRGLSIATAMQNLLISLGLRSRLIFRDDSFQFFSCRCRCGFQLVLEVYEYERQCLFSHSLLKLEMMIFPVNEHTLISTVRKHSWKHKNSIPKSPENYQFKCPWEALSFILGKPARKRSTYPVWSCPEQIFTSHRCLSAWTSLKIWGVQRYCDCRCFCFSLLFT